MTSDGVITPGSSGSELARAASRQFRRQARADAETGTRRRGSGEILGAGDGADADDRVWHLAARSARRPPGPVRCAASPRGRERRLRPARGRAARHGPRLSMTMTGTTGPMRNSSRMVIARSPAHRRSGRGRAPARRRSKPADAADPAGSQVVAPCSAEAALARNVANSSRPSPKLDGAEIDGVGPPRSELRGINAGLQPARSGHRGG